MDKCFIIMPISTPESLVTRYSGDSDHFKHVLNHLFIPAINKAKLEPVSPIVRGSDVIHGEIIKNIESTDIVLCDMSTLNANVFFELGIRTSLNKPVCLVKDDLTASVPFDTSIINYHPYSSALTPWLLDKEVDALATHIMSSLAVKGSNALWKYFGLSLHGEPIKDQSSVEGQLQNLNLQVEALRKAINRDLMNQDQESAGLEEDEWGDLEELQMRSSTPIPPTLRHLATTARALGAYVESIENMGGKLGLNLARKSATKEKIKAIKDAATEMGIKVKISLV